MPPILPSTSLIAFNITFSDDSEHRLTEINIPFYEMNIHCYTNPAKYGAMGTVEAEIGANDVIWFQNGNIRDFLFKNKVAGSNAKIVAVATVPTPYLKDLFK